MKSIVLYVEPWSGRLIWSRDDWKTRSMGVEIGSRADQRMSATDTFGDKLVNG